MCICNIHESRDDELSIIKQYDQNTIRLSYFCVFPCVNLVLRVLVLSAYRDNTVVKYCELTNNCIVVSTIWSLIDRKVVLHFKIGDSAIFGISSNVYGFFKL